ncbi:MAG: helix-turn-helix domain-containing protein [Magnetospirillum sp.]
MNEWKSQLRLLRHYHGLKQAALAEMLNVDQGTVSRWERGLNEPDLSRRKKLRDVMWKFGSRVECDIRSLMASPFGAKTLLNRRSIILDIILVPGFEHKMDRSEVIGQDARKLRGDTAYNDLWNKNIKRLCSGDFTAVHSCFFSQNYNCWSKCYAIPVVIGGDLHFFAERQNFGPKAQFESSIRIIDL